MTGTYTMQVFLPSAVDCCRPCCRDAVTVVRVNTCDCQPDSGEGDPTDPGGTTNQLYWNVTCGSLWFWNATTLTWSQINMAAAAGMYVVPTIVELRQINTISCPPVWARTIGNLVTYDGQGSEYGWEASSTDADDSMSVIKPDDVAVGDPGRWLQITSS